MKVNIYLNDRWHNNLTFDEAIELASEYYAIHGDSFTLITEVSTNRVVNEFQIEDSNRWYSFEELIELSVYTTIQVVDARHTI